jgi:PAS domain S-box-containing protein
MKSNPFARFRYLAVLWAGGSTALAFVTWVCFQLGLDSAATAFAYLIVIILLSLMDSFISSAIFSVVAVACLNFFFVEPLFTFQVEYAQDLTALVAFVITSFVITGLVRRVHGLGEAQREQARLLDLTQDAIVARGMDGLITYWNRGAEKLYGWTREEAVGKVLQQLLQTIYPVPLEQITETLVRTGRWEGELVSTRRDGRQVTVASRWSLQRDDAGRPVGTLGTNTDITERKRTEEALRRTRETFLAEAQKLSRTGSFGWNSSTGEIFWSEESFRIFGYEPAAKASIDMVIQRVHPDDLARVRQVIDRAASDKQDFDVEHRLLMPDGSVKHLHAVAHGMTDERGDLHFMGALMDITARKQAEVALRDSEQRYRDLQADFAHTARISMLGELTASIAHEVNQPLAAVTTNAETGLRWLDRPEPNVAKARELMRRIVDDARRAADIIARIRSMAARRAPKQTPLSLRDLIQESMVFLHHEIQAKKVAVSLDLAPALPPVIGDRTQLQQVIVNLSINAVQAMEQAGTTRRTLAIRTMPSDSGTVSCTVEDSGPGIAPNDRDHLFDSFFTTKDAGMGMGLPISRSIIEAHGGHIRVDNQSTLGGARFSFSLPTVAPAVR